jgi:hypothetical protein
MGFHMTLSVATHRHVRSSEFQRTAESLISFETRVPP